MDIRSTVLAQLALDFSVSPADLISGGNQFVPKRFLPGRRVYSSDGCILNVLAINGLCVMASTDETLLDWCRAGFGDADAAWIGEFESLKRLEGRLNESGWKIALAHPFFIPSGEPVNISPMCAVRWYEQDEIGQFRGDERFGEAFVFQEACPDVLGVAAVEGNELIGMAGASQDSQTMWQVGIDVLPQARGRGVGAFLTALLKDEILRRGAVPFYGTASSHIQSQKVAFRAGFMPGWWEMYTETARLLKLRDIDEKRR